MRWPFRLGVVLVSFFIAICTTCLTMKNDEVRISTIQAYDNWRNEDFLGTSLEVTGRTF